MHARLFFNSSVSGCAYVRDIISGIYCSQQQNHISMKHSRDLFSKYSCLNTSFCQKVVSHLLKSLPKRNRLNIFYFRKHILWVAYYCKSLIITRKISKLVFMWLEASVEKIAKVCLHFLVA